VPLRLIAIIFKANSPYFTLPFHGLWASPRPETAWNSSYNGWLPTVSYETQSPIVIGLLSHPFPVSRPRPWMSDFRKWREWGAKKIVPPLKRQLTFIRSTNWYKVNENTGTKGLSNVLLWTWETRERSDVVVCKIGTVSALLWYGKRSLANSLNGETVYAKPVNTMYFSINKSYKIDIFVWRSSKIK